MNLALITGHPDLADWLFLIAFIVFVIHVILTWLGVAVPRVAFVSIGLALVSMAWLVL